MPSKLNDFLESMIGTWSGNCRTWFKPDELADESLIEGRFRTLPDGLFLRHEYRSEMQGKARQGEETFAFNTASGQFEVAWFDSFHMSYAILFSVGESSEKGFVVKGEYAFAPDQPRWGWKTSYELIDDDHMVITAYNVTPDGQEAKAVEIKYNRIKT